MQANQLCVLRQGSCSLILSFLTLERVYSQASAGSVCDREQVKSFSGRLPFPISLRTGVLELPAGERLLQTED